MKKVSDGLKRSAKISGYVALAVLGFLVVISISIFIQTKINPDRIPSIFGYKPFVVLSNSMEAEIFKGDLVITKEVDANTLEKNDVVAFRDREGHVVTHRIVGFSDNNNERKLITKGDNNNSNDSETVSLKDIEGKYMFKMSGFGNVILFLQKPLALCIILLIVFGVGILWIILGNNKLSKKERDELERLRKEKRRADDNRKKQAK